MFIANIGELATLGMRKVNHFKTKTKLQTTKAFGKVLCWTVFVWNHIL